MASNKNMTITSAIKSVARFWSILSIGLILLFFFGEGLKLFELTVKELFAFILFPVGLVAGLIIAWKKEIAGSSDFNIFCRCFFISIWSKLVCLRTTLPRTLISGLWIFK